MNKKKDRRKEVFSNTWLLIIFFSLIFLLFILFVWSNSSIKREGKEENKNKSTNNSVQDISNPERSNTEQEIKEGPAKVWWLTDEEIGHAYKEIEKEIRNSPEIKLVEPSVARAIQEGGEISDDLKKARWIFFPINNSLEHEAGDTGSHWTLLVCEKSPENEVCAFFNCNSSGSSVPANAIKLAKYFSEKLGADKDFFKIYNDHVFPQQVNGSDCGVFVIAYTRALVREVGKKALSRNLHLKKADLVFTIEEERKKLMRSGFPKAGSVGGSYDISDDVAYLESEENHILEWWKEPETPIQKFIKELGLFDKDNDFLEFSSQVRRLSGKNLEKSLLKKIYAMKGMLKICSLSAEEYKKTKSFDGSNNFAEGLSELEKTYIRQYFNKGLVGKINEAYFQHFQ